MSDENLSRDASQDEKLDRIVDEILERQRGGQRLSVDEYVGLYPELEKELRELFPALNMAENLRMTPLSTSQSAEGDFGPPTQLNRNSQRFQITRILDRGGLGVVSVATDQELHREVALKEIREDRADDRGLRNKFILEAEVTGGLEHPGIVPVYALGASSNGRPYYAMRLIRGNNFRDHIRKFHEQVKSKTIVFNGPQLRQLVRRFLVVCEAVDYAHSRGVLHRDLKPSNVMVGRFGETLVVDWGLAKVTGIPSKSSDQRQPGQRDGITVTSDQETSSLETPMIPSGSDDATRDGSAIGTPGYAPPEQLLGKAESIGIHSDVYGLGAILYELLTNSPPASGSLAQITQQVISIGIPPCTSIQPLVPKPIEAICAKALAVQWNHRYASVGLLRSDIERWLDDEPVSSYAEPIYTRVRRWLKNHQTLAASLLAIGLMAILGSFLIAIIEGQSNAKLRSLNATLDKTNSELLESNHREMLARTEAEKRERSERWERYRTNMSATVSSQQVENRALMRQSLDTAPAEYRNWEWKHFDSQLAELSSTYHGGSQICPKTLLHAIVQNGSEVHLIHPSSSKPARVLKHDAPVFFSRFGPDNKLLAVTLKDNRVVIWDLATETIIASTQFHTLVGEMLFNPTRSILLVGLEHELMFAVWDFSGAKPIEIDQLWGDPLTEYAVEFNRTGDRFVYGGSNAFRLIDVDKRKSILELDGIGIGFSPSGGKLLNSHQGKLQVRDSTTGNVLHEIKGLGENPRCLDWSQDENQVLIGGRFPDMSVQLWNLSTGVINKLEGHTNGIWDVKISPDGLSALSVSQDTTARVWDLESFKEKIVLRGHRTPIRLGNFSHDGSRIITSGDESSSRVWDAQTGKMIAALQRPMYARELYYSDDDSAILCRDVLVNDSSKTSVWQSRVIEYNGILRGHSNYVYDVVYSKDGKCIASAAWDGTVRLWDTNTQKCTKVLLPPPSPDVVCFRSVSFSPDGKKLVAAGIEGGIGDVFVWDVDSTKLLQKWTCPADTEDFRASFDLSGEIALAGTTDGSVRAFNVDSGLQIHAFFGHEDGAHGSRYDKTCSDVVAHPDSKRWLTAGYDGNIVVWDSKSGKQLAKMTGHFGAIFRIRISRDGKIAASAGLDGKVRLWNLSSYELIATLDHGSAVYSAAFNLDDSRLATGAADGLIRIWDLVSYSQVAELHGHTDYVHAVDFSPDGTQLVSGAGDHTVRVWDTLSPVERNR